jgi:hypothetical protein
MSTTALADMCILTLPGKLERLHLNLNFSKPRFYYNSSKP